MIYTADYLLTLEGPPISEGAVYVEGKQIGEVGPLSQLRGKYNCDIKEFPDTILMPGLVNSHAHMELSWARGLFPEKESFSMWVARLQKALMEMGLEEKKSYIRLGALECIKSGTTTLYDLGNSDLPLNILPEFGIRSHIVREFLGLNPEFALENFRKGMEQIQNVSGLPSHLRLGIAAHALYSCSPELLTEVLTAESQFRAPYSIHMAESKEEWELFCMGKGRLLDFCRKKWPPYDPPKGEPLDLLLSGGGVPQGSLLAHCNYINAGQALALVERGASVVHCPRSREFFGHPDFPFETCFNAGLNVCLGTDSLASNETLSLFEEMAAFQRSFPHVDCEEILKMATVNGAKALGMEGQIGKLKRGYGADIIGLSLRHDRGFSLYDEIVCEEHEVNFVCIEGAEVMV